jgi:hypothetical protein
MSLTQVCVSYNLKESPSLSLSPLFFSLMEANSRAAMEFLGLFLSTLVAYLVFVLSYLRPMKEARSVRYLSIFGISCLFFLTASVSIQHGRSLVDTTDIYEELGHLCHWVFSAHPLVDHTPC